MNDVRPIDANALCEALKDWRGDADDIDENDVHDIVYYQAMSRAIRISEGAPTLDYAPVRHGEWIDEIEPNAVTASDREVHVFRCSACDFTWANKTSVLHYFKHCPNCGAKMNGGMKDENA